jgi:hypothetical protein
VLPCYIHSANSVFAPGMAADISKATAITSCLPQFISPAHAGVFNTVGAFYAQASHAAPWVRILQGHLELMSDEGIRNLKKSLIKDAAGCVLTIKRQSINGKRAHTAHMPSQASACPVLQDRCCKGIQTAEKSKVHHQAIRALQKNRTGFVQICGIKNCQAEMTKWAVDEKWTCRLEHCFQDKWYVDLVWGNEVLDKFVPKLRVEVCFTHATTGDKRRALMEDVEKVPYVEVYANTVLQAHGESVPVIDCTNQMRDCVACDCAQKLAEAMRMQAQVNSMASAAAIAAEAAKCLKRQQQQKDHAAKRAATNDHTTERVAQNESSVRSKAKDKANARAKLVAKSRALASSNRRTTPLDGLHESIRGVNAMRKECGLPPLLKQTLLLFPRRNTDHT